MQNLDHTHSRAIYMEIGERLRESLSRNQSELPSHMESQLDRLRALDDDAPSIVPSMDS